MNNKDAYRHIDEQLLRMEKRANVAILILLLLLGLGIGRVMGLW